MEAASINREVPKKKEVLLGGLTIGGAVRQRKTKVTEWKGKRAHRKMSVLPLYRDGANVKSNTSEFLDVIDPSTQQVLCK